MRLIEYTPDLETRWDEFIAETNNGTLFHTQRFLGYHPEGRFEHRHLIFEDQLALSLPIYRLVSPLEVLFFHGLRQLRLVARKPRTIPGAYRMGTLCKRPLQEPFPETCDRKLLDLSSQAQIPCVLRPSYPD